MKSNSFKIFFHIYILLFDIHIFHFVRNINILFKIKYEEDPYAGVVH